MSFIDLFAWIVLVVLAAMRGDFEVVN